MVQSKINKILADIDKKKLELLKEYEKLKQKYGFSFEEKKIVFNTKIKQYHKTLKESVVKYIFSAQLRHLISAPLIYMMIIPVSILDIFLLIYQQVCFRLYGIPLVKRRNYIVYDRKHLSYLNWLQKFNCIYCSYVNGLFSYAVEIAGRSERYRCPIKHARKLDTRHSQQKNFVDYGDAEWFKVCFNNRNGNAFGEEE